MSQIVTWAIALLALVVSVATYPLERQTGVTLVRLLCR